MDESENAALVKSRLVLISLSSFSVVLPQILWVILGYGGPFLIFVDSVLILAGFVFLLISLSTQPNSIILRLSSKLSSSVPVVGKSGNAKNFLPYLAFLMTPYFLIPYGIATMAGYTLPSVTTLLFFGIITVACIGVLVYFHKKEKLGFNVRPLYFVLPVLILGLTWAFSFWYGTPKFPTDESALDFYSAHQFLNGTNPYIPSNTANVFSFLTSLNGFPYGEATPYSSGGFVTNLTYPALAFLSFIPANVFGVYPTLTLLPLYSIPPLIVYWAYVKNNLKSVAIIPVFLILLNPSYLVQVSLGYPDIIWVIFTVLSIFYYRKPGFSGLMMGLAMAVKQIPWLLVPFLFVFILRESGKKSSMKWIAFTLITFLIVNSIFIFESPAYFYKSMAGPEMQQLIGIGFGPSQFAFLDIIPVSRFFFTFMVLAFFIIGITSYIIYYRNLKYAFLAFPIIIFLFNYRLLLSYVLFWPIIGFLMPSIMGRHNKTDAPRMQMPSLRSLGRIRKIVVPVVLVVVVSAPVFYHYSGQDQVNGNQVQFDSLKVTGVSSGNVTGMLVTFAPTNENLSIKDLQFRVIPYSAAPSMNGYLWAQKNYTKTPNGTFSVNIVPLGSSQEISWNGNFRLLVYYGNTLGSMRFSITQGKVQ